MDDLYLFYEKFYEGQCYQMNVDVLHDRILPPFASSIRSEEALMLFIVTVAASCSYYVPYILLHYCVSRMKVFTFQVNLGGCYCSW